MSYLRHGYGGHHDKGVMARMIRGPCGSPGLR